MAHSPSNYRPDIEGLRGVAVFLVVAYHAFNRGFYGGFIGVDVFFVLSGYLITGLLVREIEQTGRLSFANFYARRARRLLPASAFVVLATVFASYFLAAPITQYRAGVSGIYTALYASNFWFLRQATDYFAPQIKLNPFLHTWSLAVEEQFYLIWPAIIAFALGAFGVRKRGRGTLRAVMLAIAALSFAACFYLTSANRAWAFFSSPTRAWEFAVGGIAFLGMPWKAPRNFRAPAGWLGFAAILAASLTFNGEENFPGWRALFPVLGTAAILIGRDPRFGAARLLELRALQWLGKLSYSLYLWHWPILAIAHDINPYISPSARALCVAGAAMLAVATHYLIENPIRFNAYLAGRRALSLALAGGVTAVTACAALVWYQSMSHLVEAPDRLAIVRAAGGPEIELACHVGFSVTTAGDCFRGDLSSRYTVVLFGDSHAQHIEPAFEALANARGWRLDLISKPSCPTPRVTVFSPVLNRRFPECDAWREDAIQHILKLHPAAIVIFNAKIFADPPDPNGNYTEWRDGSRKTLETFDAAGIPTVVLRDNPWPGFEVPYCVAGLLDPRWHIYRDPARSGCSFTRASGLNDGVYRAEREAGDGLRHVSFLDLTDVFCDGDVCPPVKNGLVIYRDHNHLAAAFAKTLAPALAERLLPLLPPWPR